ncbi:MAG: FHA domain-containing protein [Candidatus Obscuribacterales bacterium]|nr:FHA domain-containing protein [Candidatus Obscuribacterales bacterium]
MENNQEGQKTPTAYLVDLVSNRKIPVATPRCRVGRDDLNDIVISGDQSISRFHFIISYENDEFTVQDAKSRHGTFLNGNQLTSPETIKDGDVLKVGVSLFWFVVEQADKAAGDGAEPSTKAIEGQGDSPIDIKEAKDLDGPIPGAKDHTQEMAKPDASLIEKLEQAANSIQLQEEKKEEEKPKAKASLASLLSPLADGGDKEDQAKEEQSKEEQAKEDDVKAKLAAKDKELLKEIEAAAESAAEEATTGDAVAAKKLDKFPERILNKPSDTVTIEALPMPGTLQEKPVHPTESVDAGKDEVKAEDGDASKSEPAEKVIEPPKLALGNLLAQSESKREEEEKEREEEEAKRRAEEEAEAKSQEAEPEAKDNNGKHDTALELQSVETAAAELPEESSKEEAPTQESPVIDASEVQKQSQTGEIKLKAEGGESSAPAETEPIAAAKEVKEIIPEPQVSVPVEANQDKLLTAGASSVPDWCKRYFSDEIGKLNTELDELNEQVKQAQQKIRDVETRVALTKGIRNTLLTTTGDELVEACGKVMGLIGWKVTIAADDKNELRLESDDKQVSIARVIWTTTQAERSHLGQLSISQTRYWCEKGTEPKGILIVSKIGDGPPQVGGDSAEDLELQEYASKKNVCLMTTLQLLSLYKEVALGEGKPEALRAAVIQGSGWLSGYDLEPGKTEPAEKEEGANKLSSLLSAT